MIINASYISSTISLTNNNEQILLNYKHNISSKIDENNKSFYIREILECQRLLLTIHAKKQNINPKSLYVYMKNGKF
jgi:hypothetical protein